MTNKEKAIIRRYVNESLDSFKDSALEYGANSDYAKNARSVWVVLRMLWCEFFPNEDPRGWNEDEHDNK